MPRDDLVLVGIGASAGGLEAIERFFTGVHPDPAVSYVIVQHLSPDHRSLMGELLARHTDVPIREVADGTLVEPANVYLMARRANMTIFNNRLFLAEPDPGLNLPIDVFFESLAEDYGERAVAVVLSGTGSDGTRGVRAIKEAGGAVFVQDTTSARFDGMPDSAARTGIVDDVLAPQEMPGRIARYARSSLRGTELDAGRDEESEGTITRILHLVKQRTGVDLSNYKPSTIARRIERRIALTDCETVDGYLDYLRDEPTEVDVLYKEILIGVTRFFRDPEAFETLAGRVIPEIVRNTAEGDALRVWVPACSTGEEAYSIAIVLAEYLEDNRVARTVRIFATDVDRDAVQFASAGIYSESIAADASPQRLRRFFVRHADGYQIAPDIRESVVFAHHSVIADPPFRHIHLLSCRNLLIYLQPRLQQKVLANFAFSVDPGGFLFLGSSESTGDFARSFEAVDLRWKLYRSTERRTRGEADLRYSHPDPGAEATHVSSRPARRRPREAADETLPDRILESVLPPSVLVDEDRGVERVFGDVSRYLQFPAGKVDFDILKLARDPISIPLGNALGAAIRGSRRVTTGRLPATPEAAGSFTISVTPVQAAHRYLYLITFEDETDGSDDPVADFTVEESVRQRIHDLETELQHSQENLQATIEELETSNEELQATNEELLSSNEELQSANEELQSVNQELISVNAEYQKKIEELSRLTADMDNLLAATPVGTIFLDRELRVRTFTPAAAEQFNIIATDVGRPIAEISHRLDYPDLGHDVRAVAETGRLAEREVDASGGRRYLVRILPYAQDGEPTTGVVLGLVDVGGPTGT